jgi:hypothetical protein
MGFDIIGRLTAIPKVRVTDREKSLQHNFDFCLATFPVPCYLYPGSPEERINLERALS